MLGNPRAQKEFRDTLHELFKDKVEKPKLVIVTHEDEARYNVAARRYVHAIDALRLCHQYPLSYEFRTRALDDFVTDGNGNVAKDENDNPVKSPTKARLVRAIKNFNRGIRLDDQRRIYELAERQKTAGPGRKGEWMGGTNFLKQLRDSGASEKADAEAQRSLP